MLGAIIGDIVGSVCEWNNIKTKEFPLFSDKCSFTDDTVMTIAVADALLNGGTADNFIDSMKKFGKLYPNSGYGGNFMHWIHSDTREPYNSWGNGSAMRVSACGWFAKSLERAEALAERSAVVTHNHPEGIKGAQATAAAIFLARTGNPRDETKRYIENK
jgi:ADP-ribosylglycohydrolase